MGEAKRRNLIKATLEESAKTPEPCRRCGEPTHHRGVYQAYDQRRVSAPKGKTRFLIYAMCETCQQTVEKDPGLLDAIEASLETEALAINPDNHGH